MSFKLYFSYLTNRYICCFFLFIFIYGSLPLSTCRTWSSILAVPVACFLIKVCVFINSTWSSCVIPTSKIPWKKYVLQFGHNIRMWQGGKWTFWIVWHWHLEMVCKCLGREGILCKKKHLESNYLCYAVYWYKKNYCMAKLREFSYPR